MTDPRNPVSGPEALARLRDGNARFVGNVRSIDALVSQATRGALVEGQSPFATVLSCSDSRAPSEILFDCGLGELFVVRVAGNVAAPSLVGSVEYAAATFGTELVVVMGHSNCGAVSATIDVLQSGGGSASDNIRDIVERIAPSIVDTLRPGVPREEILRAAVRANVRATVSHLRHGSRLLEKRVDEGRLMIVGAEYSLESGIVEFFDGLGRRLPTMPPRVATPQA